MGQIFSDDAAKKRATSVDKCDDENKWPITDLKQM